MTSDIKVSDIDTGMYNPFDAVAEELLASALDEAGLLKPVTTINEKSATDYLKSFFQKRSHYQEITRLGALLVRRGVMGEDDLQRALERQREKKLRLGEALIELNICSLEEIEKNLDAQVHIRDGIKDLEEFRKKIEAIKARLRHYF